MSKGKIPARVLRFEYTDIDIYPTTRAMSLVEEDRHGKGVIRQYSRIQDEFGSPPLFVNWGELNKAGGKILNAHLHKVTEEAILKRTALERQMVCDLEGQVKELKENIKRLREAFNGANTAVRKLQAENRDLGERLHFSDKIASDVRKEKKKAVSKADALEKENKELKEQNEFLRKCALIVMGVEDDTSSPATCTNISPEQSSKDFIEAMEAMMQFPFNNYDEALNKAIEDMNTEAVIDRIKSGVTKKK